MLVAAPRALRRFPGALHTAVRGAAGATHFKRSPLPHPLLQRPTSSVPLEFEPEHQHVWTPEELAGVEQTHRPAKDAVDRVAYGGIKALRFAFDAVSGYLWGPLTPQKILRRVLFLECAAGVPGMVAGSLRHLRSLRRLEEDHGWIQTLLEESENERMHMLTFMHCYRPGVVFRSLVLVTQGVFWNAFFLAYLASPRLAHRFVGYLEEEAVRTYTHIIETMESDDPAHAAVRKFGQSAANEVAIAYWRLRPDATMLDVMKSVRADEATHRDVNHCFASLHVDAENPYVVKKFANCEELRAAS